MNIFPTYSTGDTGKIRKASLRMTMFPTGSTFGSGYLSSKVSSCTAKVAFSMFATDNRNDSRDIFILPLRFHGKYAFRKNVMYVYSALSIKAAKAHRSDQFAS
jgi:hypothetical protein